MLLCHHETKHTIHQTAKETVRHDMGTGRKKSRTQRTSEHPLLPDRENLCIAWRRTIRKGVQGQGEGFDKMICSTCHSQFANDEYCILKGKPNHFHCILPKLKAKLLARITQSDMRQAREAAARDEMVRYMKKYGCRG